jgi:hypothetical protein
MTSIKTSYLLITESQFKKYDKPYVACGIARTYSNENVIPEERMDNAIATSRTARQLDAKLRNLSLKFGIPILVNEATMNFIDNRDQL